MAYVCAIPCHYKIYPSLLHLPHLVLVSSMACAASTVVLHVLRHIARDTSDKGVIVLVGACDAVVVCICVMQAVCCRTSTTACCQARARPRSAPCPRSSEAAELLGLLLNIVRSSLLGQWSCILRHCRMGPVVLLLDTAWLLACWLTHNSRHNIPGADAGTSLCCLMGLVLLSVCCI